MIPPEFIQTLLGRIDLVDLIGQSVPLKKAGVNYVARCPFHQEKTPSFSVSPARQFFHCFGCGASGNAISFVMQHRGAGFVDAVQQLADLVGLPVPHSSTATPTPPPRPHLEALEQISHHYQQALQQHPRALSYITRRGIKAETTHTFRLGYAPPGWHGLTHTFPHFPTALLIEIGMVIQQEGGGVHDRFRDRLMFPIQNSRGQIIGFGGRILDQGEPKYLNSPETPLFEKGQELYGWPQARQALRQNHEMLVVEGYMDVISLSQAGLGHVVATLGTAITEFQVKRLLRSTDRLVFAFDGDNAGRKAALRAMERVLPWFEEGKDIAFLFFPEGEDPDSFVRQQGAAALQEKVSQALPLSSFVMDHLSEGLQRHLPEGQGQFLKRAQTLLGSLRSPWLTFALKKRMAEWLDLSLPQLDQFLGSTKTPERSPTRTPIASPLTSRLPPTTLARQLIACLMADPALVHQIGMPLEDPLATTPEERQLFPFADHLRHQDITPSLPLLIEHFRGKPEENTLDSILAKEFIPLSETPSEELAMVYRDGLARWGQQIRQREIDQWLEKARHQPLTPDEQARLQALVLTRPFGGG